MINTNPAPQSLAYSVDLSLRGRQGSKDVAPSVSSTLQRYEENQYLSYVLTFRLTRWMNVSVLWNVKVIMLSRKGVYIAAQWRLMSLFTGMALPRGTSAKISFVDLHNTFLQPSHSIT